MKTAAVLPAVLALVFNRLTLVVIFIFSLFTLHFSLAPSVHAQVQPPAPAPCTNAVGTYQLTDNYVTTDEGEAPYITFGGSDQPGPPNQNVTIPVNTSFEVDFSQLAAVFGAENSNYQDGGTQAEEHRQANVVDLKKQDFNEYFGPAQKTSSKRLVDDLKVEFVDYVSTHPHLLESDDLYTDINGENPKNIYQLVTEYGVPIPPKPDDDKTEWLSKWGKYWPKIPTSYAEFYWGSLEFRAYAGDETFNQLKNGVEGQCPVPTVLRRVDFVMPEFKRTIGISDHLNRVVVPCAVQSFRHGIGTNGDDCPKTTQTTTQNQENNDSILATALKFCKKLVTDFPKNVATKIKKSVKTTLNKLNPLKNAFAQVPTPTPIPCFKVLAEGKEGNAPFCAVPPTNSEGQLQLSPGECTYKESPTQLDKGNPNIVCRFNVSGVVTIPINPDPDYPEWNSCTDNGNGTFTCSTSVRVFPVFRIPFLSEIWNDTLYSDEAETNVGSPQEAGRPGIYSIFSPKAIFEKIFNQGVSKEEFEQLKAQCIQDSGGSNQEPASSSACDQLFDLYDELAANRPGFSCDPGPRVIDLIRCFGLLYSQIGKNLPGQVADGVLGQKDSKVLAAGSDTQKERFIGATDCSKFFVRDIALKPKALQEAKNINKQECNLQAAAIPGSGQPPGEPPGGFPPTADNCNGAYSLNNPLGNFGDPNCDFSPEAFAIYLRDDLGLPDWENFYNIAFVEGGHSFQPNAYNPNAANGDSAWGLFQMAREGFGNTEYDRGDVEWHTQAFNAVQYNNSLPPGSKYCYWEAAFPAHLNICEWFL